MADPTIAFSDHLQALQELLAEAKNASELLSDLRRQVSDNEGENILGSAIVYLREQAYSFIPYGATTPNKDSYGRRYGKRV